MKSLQPLLLILLLSFSGKAQVEVSGFPKDYQLFPRSVETNLGLISFDVSFSDDYELVKAYLYSGSEVKGSEVINSSSSISNHTFSIPIAAGLQEYELQLYAFSNSSDSVLLKEANGLVCGDVIVIYGQSNCFGYSSIYRASPHSSMRTALLSTDQHSVSWDKAIHRKYDLGEFGVLMGDSLINQLGVAVCVINRGASGRDIDFLKLRNESNPFDPGNWYGGTLSLLQKAGLLASVQAFIFRHGESEAMTKYLPTFESYFEKLEELIDNLKTDFPQLEKIYITQLNVLHSPDFDLFAGSTVREAQRKSESIEKVEVISTQSLQNEFDGAHFSFDGHTKISGWISQLMKEQVYGFPRNDSSYSPSIQKVYFANTEHDSLILEFDIGQNLWSEFEKNGKQLINYFYLEDGKGIKEVSAIGNRVFLKLWDPSSSNTLTYLPSSVQDLYGYNGPLIKNEAGIAALSFYKFPITDIPLASPANLIARLRDNAIQLNWQNIEERNHSLILVKKIDDVVVSQITLAQGSQTYSDESFELINDRVYYYELWLENGSEASTAISTSYNVCPSTLTESEVCEGCSLYQGSALILSGPVSVEKLNYFAPSIVLEPGFSTAPDSTFEIEVFQCGEE